MDMPTTIFGESPEIRLRQTTLCDLDFVIRVESKEENIKFIIPWQRGKHESAINNEDIAHIIIEDKETNYPLGFMIIAGLQNPNQSIEFMRIVITEKGKGVGREALKLIKKWVFEELNANRLWLDVKANNDRAKSVYELEGFSIEGTLRECLKIGDEFESLILMSILRSEYEYNKRIGGKGREGSSRPWNIHAK
ncbi:GNAT family N-acetyltransferase [Brevibacillus invocatus]|uniref:GNAT family N-acetyltransferase n=2 Tax=Brevibacillus invocatus TaxID=173959 RepID=UPI00203B6378|nr:GNAT family protein [Brevibacillus invocatus]MCM3431981.1 GNAT family N-acetyltransferase [Brevibacillus invocatus]